MRMAAPVHPGPFIHMEIIKPRGLSVTAAALVLRVKRTKLSEMLHKRVALSPEMALRIEKAFGVEMETLLHMQMSFEAAAMRQREDEIEVKPFIGPPKKQIRRHRPPEGFLHNRLN